MYCMLWAYTYILRYIKNFLGPTTIKKLFMFFYSLLVYGIDSKTKIKGFDCSSAVFLLTSYCNT